MENSALKIKEWFRSQKIVLPSLHVVLGSGLASSLDGFDKEHLEKNKSDWKLKGILHFSDIPGINPSTAPGHSAAFKFYEKNGKTLSFQTGRLHGYEGHTPQAVVKPLSVLCDLGVQKFILTNAAGSLQAHMKAGSVMMINDQVNFTGLNPLTGPNDESKGPRFPDMSQCYSPRINEIIKKNLLQNNVVVHHGTYIGVNGPCFESAAEVKLFSNWGMGAVGMSTVFEAIALRHRGSEVGGLSFLANMGTGLAEKAHEKLSGDEVLEEGKKKAPLLLSAIFKSAEELI
jgi:purine-nucleoside phosphorylase